GFARAISRRGRDLAATVHELPGLHESGAIIPVEMTLGRWTQQGVQHFSAVIHDISERKAHERELSEAKIAAEAASRAKSEFLSSMSHELRTPLNAILGFSQLLEFNPAEPLQTEQKVAVGEIHKAGKHLLDLINDVLDLSRIETGKLTLSIEDVDLADLIVESMPLAQAQADKYGVAIGADAGGHYTVRADRTRLKQVLLNLMSNGAKFNKPGGRVELTFAPRGDGRVRIAARDDGIGIPADMQERLFQPFNRIGAEGGNIEGTGIGLVIAKRLVEDMGGSIGFESTPGEGSVFWVDLPLARAE
ncbi:MAG: PAS domain S-box protein, partial [Alphaproteobacteria bacterium]|nr:PAS domain S-box protein [Alphaproteobacteria bacterium]